MFIYSYVIKLYCAYFCWKYTLNIISAMQNKLFCRTHLWFPRFSSHSNNFNNYNQFVRCILSVITSHCAVNSPGYWRVSVTDTSRVLLIVWKRCKACILRLSPWCCVNKVTVFVDACRAIHILLTLRMATACCVFCADKDVSKAEFVFKKERLNGDFNRFPNVGVAKKNPMRFLNFD